MKVCRISGTLQSPETYSYFQNKEGEEDKASLQEKKKVNIELSHNLWVHEDNNRKNHAAENIGKGCNNETTKILVRLGRDIAHHIDHMYNNGEL